MHLCIKFTCECVNDDGSVACIRPFEVQHIGVPKVYGLLTFVVSLFRLNSVLVTESSNRDPCSEIRE
jgi:hypothetical protein